MRRLRQKQADALRGRAMAAFESNAIRHLRRDLPEQTAIFTDEMLLRRLRSCITRAGDYGLNTQKQIMCFVDVTYLLGEQFDTDPRHAWSAEILRSQKLAAGDKANLLLATACSVSQNSQTGD